MTNLNLWRRKYMSNKGIIILVIIWMLFSLVWFLAGNTVKGIIWLCVGVIAVIIALIRNSK